jgi:L-amino acid N-acyltransferase YncA
MKITAMNASRWEDVKRIYQQGIDTGHATFEEYPPKTWEVWSAKFLSNLQLICLDEDTLLGWAAISRVSSRQVYKGVGEVSLYIDPDHQGRGIGKDLLYEIVSLSENNGFWTLQAGIFPENIISLELHQCFGFRVVGTRKKVGKMTYGPMAGEWRDVLFLERRSEIIGLKTGSNK